MVYVEIETATYALLEQVARDNGIATVDELLTRFALDFSHGCSVTLSGKGSRAGKKFN